MLYSLQSGLRYWTMIFHKPPHLYVVSQFMQDFHISLITGSLQVIKMGFTVLIYIRRN